MTNSQATNPPWGTGSPARLPVRATAREAYCSLWSRRNELLRVAVPVALILLLEVALAFWAALDSAPGLEAADIWSALTVLLSIPLGVLMAVNWLRVLVLGSAAVPGLGVRWGQRETRFLLRWLAINLTGFGVVLVFAMPVMLAVLMLSQVVAVPEIVLQLVPLLILPAVMPIYAYVTLRQSLALVTAATEAPGGLRESWMVTRGLGGRLVLAAVAVVGPFYLLVFLMPALLHVSGVEAAMPLSSLLLRVVLAMLTYAAGLALVSVIHRRLGGLRVSSE